MKRKARPKAARPAIQQHCPEQGFRLETIFTDRGGVWRHLPQYDSLCVEAGGA